MKSIAKSLGSVLVIASLSFVGVVGVFYSAAAAQPSMISPFVSPIYGDDDRRDLYQVSDPALLKLADSTVALIAEERLDLELSGKQYRMLGLSLKDRRNICSSEPFADQLTLSFCSGVLVAPDLVLTAGHCIEDLDDCNTTRIAFGFSLRRGAMKMGTLPAKEVYSCREIIKNEVVGPDYAVIRLDRAVVGHAPVGISRTGTIEIGTPLFVIGHPDGLPAKISGGAFVRNISGFYKFASNLDTYHGNSGSPVFNARTRLIEGILVQGDLDYAFDQVNHCVLNKHCTNDGCIGEKSTRVIFAAPYIPDLDVTHPGSTTSLKWP